MRDHRGRTALADDADVAEACVGQQLRHRLGTAPDFVTSRGVGPYRLDADERFEVGTHGRQDFAHTGGDIGHDTQASGTLTQPRACVNSAHDAACRPQTRTLAGEGNG
jgi:hypothetical protein